MSKIDLTSLEWRELVFEGKNKQYGAYVLRGGSNKRHNIAMAIITLVSVVAFLSPYLMKMIVPKEKETVTEVTQLSQLEKAEVKQEVKRVIPLEPPPALKSTIKFTAPVIKKDEEVNDQDQIKSQEDLNKTTTAISIADVKGNDDVNGKDIADIKVAVTQHEEVEQVYDMANIEQQPQFPGGDAELMSFINKNTKYPAIALENRVQGKVIVEFVVSKSGKVTKVRVKRSVDPALDREAVRVVELIPDFIPGKQNGQNVPVTYMLPVSFKMATE
jgi:periplasmic protein TonB